MGPTFRCRMHVERETRDPRDPDTAVCAGPGQRRIYCAIVAVYGREAPASPCARTHLPFNQSINQGSQPPGRTDLAEGKNLGPSGVPAGVGIVDVSYQSVRLCPTVTLGGVIGSLVTRP